jgi:hypothetical protein
MWFYPLPALLAFVGFVYVLIMRNNFLKQVRYAALIAILGLALFLIRSWLTGEWPFGRKDPSVRPS